MGILDRIKSRRAKKERNPSGETEYVPLSSVMENPQELSITNMDSPEKDRMQVQQPAVQPATQAVTAVQPNAPSWVTAGSYEEAAKTDPNISRAQYAYEVSKHRREQGLPDLSYAEWGNIVKGHDPYETEADRQKREKNMRMAKNINAIGSFINALVNYNRVKRGSVGYTPDKGTDTYNRLERIRLNQEQLARSNAKDYLGYIAMDRAERAKEQAAAAAAAQAKQNYELKVQELEWKKENAKTEAERKKAADELAKMEFEETQRHNKEMEKTARIRANKTGTGGSDSSKVVTSAIGDDGSVWTRNSKLSMEEAMILAMGTKEGNDPDFLEKFRAKSTTTNDDGSTVRVGDINWTEVATSLMAAKKIPSSLLLKMGYSKSKDDAEDKYQPKDRWDSKTVKKEDMID